MFSFIDHKLRVIKQVHKEFMSALYVIMTGDFYQVPLVQNLWIFKLKTNNSIFLELIFGMKK